MKTARIRDAQIETVVKYVLRTYNSNMFDVKY